LIQSLFHAWERRLAFSDDFERRVLPFDWGADFLPSSRAWNSRDANGADPRETLHEHARRALADSDAYFELGPVDDFSLDGGQLTFTSPAPTGVAANDRVHASVYPAGLAGPAVVVLPHWNAKEGAQDGLCRLLNRFGVSAVKLALPYHEQRMPAELVRADFTLSPNIGRTLQSCRQAVVDARAVVSWLETSGYGPIGIVGTSLGSAIAFVVTAHEPRLAAGVFNHISPYFADVVWRGISTRQVREGLEQGVGLSELRKLWLPLSPASYYAHMVRRRRPSLLIYGRYDLSFPPDLSRELLRDFQKLEIPHEVYELRCGHYTTAIFPFNWMDGLRIARFLKDVLGR
jgi:pimeloyl-ACP methyl ester carboxylesterase